MREVLHWLPITARIHYKILFLLSKAQLGNVAKYLSDYNAKSVIRILISLIALC